MKIIVTGASGFLGTKLFTTLKRQGNEIIGTSLSRQPYDFYTLDITNKNATNLLFTEERPDLVIHCAGMARPGVCQANPDRARKVNVEGTANVVDACNRAGASLVYPSSIYVFGDSDKPRRETDKINPINIYGETKAKAEELIRQRCPHSIITRTDMLYGYNGRGNENGLFGVIASGRPITLDDKRIRQPLLVDDWVTALQFLLKKEFFGTIHLAGDEQITQYGLGRRLAQLMRTDAHISMSDKEQGVPRLTNYLIDCGVAESYSIKPRLLRESISIIKEQMNSRNEEGGSKRSIEL